MKQAGQMFEKAKPYLGAIALRFGSAGMSIISKAALNQGMNQLVTIVYRYSVGAIVVAPFAFVLDRKVRPKMTLPIFAKILLLGLLEPVIAQSLIYSGTKYTTATFATAMCNILPAFAFIMAWICKMEKVNIRRLRSQAKILGTLVTVGGAMMMTLIKGPLLNLPWTKENSNPHSYSSLGNKQEPVKAAIVISISSICSSAFTILLAHTIRSYPAEFTLTTFICLAGAVESTILALAFEWNNPAAWALHADSILLAALYGGIISSGIAYYIQGVVVKLKGPVFVTAFNPLSMVVVAVISSFIFAERLRLGRVIGAVVIIMGLYLVLWGKSKDKVPFKVANNNTDELPTSLQDSTTTNQQQPKPLDQHLKASAPTSVSN
ncbi:WAT1-related protein At2g39510-like [Cucurbita pepo subsp. pepo]|uniref:WAT1-related protein At2g39510-like n=1 Tax=Cucurbita pepo subsp. pepo TaxID=3664 RepID=UPI000C9D360E|nr:WAT1-related protein At2g39510-like [Cucurbita pepo subsp. pepo]